jgi:two-component SAPR family response regulator
MRPPKRPRLDGKKVLIVEDDFLEADDMRDAVECIGGIVVGPALSVDTALGLIEGVRPDVAVLDVVLFRMTSVSIAERLSQLHVPFVVVSAYPRERLPPPLDTGPYVSKPYWRKQLTDALGRAIASAH